MKNKKFPWRTALWGASLLLIALAACGSTNTQQRTRPARELDKYLMRDDLTTQELVYEMGLGINLGNTMEACGDWINKTNIRNYETAWGSPEVSERMIAGYAEAGFSSLRIPVAWSNMMLDDYVILPALLDRVEQIVNWTIDNGMIAMINLHWDGGWWEGFAKDDDYEECKKKFISIWTQVGGRFRDYGDCLLFEPMNEVGFGSIWNQWGGSRSSKEKAFGLVNEMNQIFVDVVRSSGGNNEKRHLVIEVYDTNIDYAYDPLFKMPDDPANRSAATVHYYTPAVFAILDEDASWGKARPTWGTAADLRELNNYMDQLKRNVVDKGIPVIVGEFAANPKNKTQDMVRLYAVTVAEAAYSRGMCPMLWDTSGDQYNRQTRTWRDPLFVKEFMAIEDKWERP